MKKMFVTLAVLLTLWGTAYAGPATEWRDILAKVPEISVGKSINSIGGFVEAKHTIDLPEVSGHRWGEQPENYDIGKGYPKVAFIKKLDAGKHRLFLFPQTIDEINARVIATPMVKTNIANVTDDLLEKFTFVRVKKGIIELQPSGKASNPYAIPNVVFSQNVPKFGAECWKRFYDIPGVKSGIEISPDGKTVTIIAYRKFSLPLFAPGYEAEYFLNDYKSFPQTPVQIGDKIEIRYK